MSRRSVLAFAAALSAVAPGLRAAEEDTVLRAMREELARSRTLRVPNLESPYFVQYAVEDADGCSLDATLGGLVRRRQVHIRIPEIRVRVGDYSFDNTNYVGSSFPFGPRYDLGRFPLDDLYPVIRRYFWLGTDTTYKSAVEAISRKRAALKNLTVSEKVNDFAHAAPLRMIRPVTQESIDLDSWASRIRSVSAILGGREAVRDSMVEFQAMESVRYLVNSEGTEVRAPGRTIYLLMRGESQAPDGMLLRDTAGFYSLDFAGLPPPAELEKAAREVADHLAALAGAPKGEDYNGPVLFEGRAAAQIFAEVLGRGFAPVRRPVTEPGRAGGFPSSELEGRQGARILPEWMDVTDDPARTDFQGRRLFGSYAVDREGVVPKALPLVEKGVLENFLLTRQPVRGFEGSNGHARLPGAFGADTATPGNLFITAAQTSPLAELKKKVIEICQARGKPYGILVRKMDFPSSARFSEVRRILTSSGSGSRPVSSPVLVYRIYPDGREELIRGLRFRGLNARSFKDILMAGNDQNVFDYMENGAPFALLGAALYTAETSVIAPSVLIDDLELHPLDEELPKLPVVPPPELASSAQPAR